MNTSSPAHRRADRGESGASTVELTLYLPLMMFVIFATVQASLLFLGHQAAGSAAREAARVARTGQGSAAAMLAAQRRGQQWANQVGAGVLTGAQVTLQQVPPDQVRATVTGHAVQLVPGLPGSRIRAVAQGPVEGFRADR